jgi:hypothetical protein
MQVTMDGNPIMLKGSVFSTSTGDEAGSAGGGVASVTITGEAQFALYSFDVRVEGKNVCRLGDIMLLNQLSSPNTPPFPEVQPPMVILPTVMSDDPDKPADIGLFDRER